MRRYPLLWRRSLLVELVMIVVSLAAGTTRTTFRFLAGMPITGRYMTNASFLYPGEKDLTPVNRRAPRWAYRPYWQTAVVRWALVGLVAGWVWARTATLIALGVLSATALFFAGRYAWGQVKRWRMRKHTRDTVAPLFSALVGHLAVPASDSADKWLTIPSDYATNRDAVIVVNLPTTWQPNEAVQKRIAHVVRERLGLNLEVSWKHTELRAVFTAPPAPPRKVAYAGHNDPAHVIRVGQTARAAEITVNMESESPHWFVSGAPGAGKTTLLRVPAAHTRSKGWLVDIIDPKRRSFKAAFDQVAGIRLHTDVESMIEAMSEFFLSMLGANMAVEAGADPDSFPERLLVIDEFGSFTTMVNRYWKKSGKKGSPPILDQFMYLLWQGRQANHRIIVGVHQPNLKVFGSSDARDLFDVRIATGPVSVSKWRMMFGYTPRLTFDSRIKGRGIIGLGEDDIREVQLTFLDEPEARAVAESGPAVPGWFQRHELAPWIVAATLSEAEKSAGYDLSTREGTELHVPATMPTPVPASVPPDVPVSTSGVTLPVETADVAAGQPGNGAGESPEWVEDFLRRIAEESSGEPLPGVAETAPGPRSSAVSVRPTVPPKPRDSCDDPAAIPLAEDLIIGLQAAALFLGYDKVGSFKRARTRAPIPGETRTEDGRPAWTPRVLRSWQSKRKIAGARPLPFSDADEHP